MSKLDCQVESSDNGNNCFSTTPVPEPKEIRLEKLFRILGRQDVPFPIVAERAKEYFELADSGKPFAVGTLTGQTVDLAGFQNEQHFDKLTQEDHLSWAQLVADQQAAKHQFACKEYLEGEELFEIGGSVIPDYYHLNARIFQQTGWQLATVSEIIPAHVFFHCHSRKFFPVTTFMRPLGTDYLEEPDIGHDIAGHVATFTIPQVAEVMNHHGFANDIILREKNIRLADAKTKEEKASIEAEATELLKYAGRLYWFTVEFGLVLQQDGLKAFGAGILSSPGETRYSIQSPDSNRVLIDVRNDRDLLRLATTDYLISEFQKTYFVLNDFDSLSSLTPDRIVKIVKMAQRLPHHTWRELVPGDEVIDVGSCLMSPNEKYNRLVAGQQQDECLVRTAIRNLEMANQSDDTGNELEREFMKRLPDIPEQVFEKFWRMKKSGMIETLLRLEQDEQIPLTDSISKNS